MDTSATPAPGNCIICSEPLEALTARVCATCWGCWDQLLNDVCITCGAPDGVNALLLCAACSNPKPLSIEDLERSIVRPTLNGESLATIHDVDRAYNVKNILYGLSSDILYSLKLANSRYPHADARILDPSIWPLPAPDATCDTDLSLSYYRNRRVPIQIRFLWNALYVFLIPGRPICVNHYALRQPALGHSYENCNLVGPDNIRHAVVQWGDTVETFWTIKRRPGFLLSDTHRSVCFKCFVPVLLHRPDLRSCALGDIIPQLLFLLWVHHREHMVASDALSEVTSNTTFARYWSMLKLPDEDGYRNIIRYTLFAVWGLGVENLGFEVDENCPP